MGRWDDEDEQLWFFGKGLTFDGWEKYKIKKVKLVLVWVMGFWKYNILSSSFVYNFVISHQNTYIMDKCLNNNSICRMYNIVVGDSVCLFVKLLIAS